MIEETKTLLRIIKMSNLKIWQNESDVIIAESQEDAESLLVELCGEEVLENCGDWYCLDDETNFTLAEEHDEPPYTKIRTQKANQWVKQHGRGYFASTEY